MNNVYALRIEIKKQQKHQHENGKCQVEVLEKNSGVHIFFR